jgi:SPP1 family predicted phage head-tail adaptor
MALINDLSLPAGSLRHAITILTASSTQDAAGQPVATWTEVLATRGGIRTLTGREMTQNDQITSQVTHEITLRWTPVTIAPGMRVSFGSHTYQIQATENVLERNRVLRLQVLAVNDAE